jgi:hypothetical protein
MIPNTTMKISGGTISADGIRRTFDMKRSMVIAAEGAVKIELIADLGFGMPVPLSLTATFSLQEPVKDEVAPAEDAPAATPQAAQPAKGLLARVGACLQQTAARISTHLPQVNVARMRLQCTALMAALRGMI